MRRRHWLFGAGAASSLPVWAQGLDALLAQRSAAYQPRLAWRPEADWRPQALASARRHILQPGDDGRPIGVQRLATEDRGDHLAERLRLPMSLGDVADALWLRPKVADPVPALLLLHDHGARFDIGAEKLIRPLAAEPQLAPALAWAQRYFDGRFLGEVLVRRGYAVLAVDALGWGSRSRVGFARDDQQALAAQLQQLGLHWAGVIASDDARSLRWLRGQAEVDARAVGVLGFSMGAFRAWQLAAVDEGWPPAWRRTGWRRGATACCALARTACRASRPSPCCTPVWRPSSTTPMWPPSLPPDRCCCLPRPRTGCFPSMLSRQRQGAWRGPGPRPATIDSAFSACPVDTASVPTRRRRSSIGWRAGCQPRARDRYAAFQGAPACFRGMVAGAASPGRQCFKGKPWHEPCADPLAGTSDPGNLKELTP